MNKESYKLKCDLDILRSKSGRSTELISLYINHSKQIHEVMSKLREESNQASNIKSRLTRQNVQSALDSLLSKLKLYNKIPYNGLVIFCGSVDIGGNKTDLQSYTIEPPEPITFYKYNCDSKFLIEPLEYMLYDKKIFGLIIIDRNECTIGILNGKNIQLVETFQSNIMGKHNKGGQSAHRFQELHRIAINEFYVRIAEKANNAFLPLQIEGIILGGPSYSKDEFKKSELLDYRLQNKILGSYDTGYTDEYGLKELFDKSLELLEELEIVKEKKYMSQFLKELGGLSSYGKENIIEDINNGRVDKLLISENIDISSINNILDIADSKSTEVIFISCEFEEGNQLLNTFGGLGALLRY